MKRLSVSVLVSAIFVLYSVLAISGNAFGKECLSIGDDLSFTIPCGKYQGAKYKGTWKYKITPSDPSGLSWFLDVKTFTSLDTEKGCTPIDDDLILKVIFNNEFTRYCD